MDEEKQARKNTQISMDEFDHPNSPIFGRVKCWKHLTQRWIKDSPAYGWGIVQVISQIYGWIKLATENTIRRRVILRKHKEW